MARIEHVALLRTASSRPEAASGVVLHSDLLSLVVGVHVRTCTTSCILAVVELETVWAGHGCRLILLRVECLLSDEYTPVNGPDPTDEHDGRQ